MILHYERGTADEIIDDFEYEVEDYDIIEDVLKPEIKKWSKDELISWIKDDLQKLSKEELLDLFMSLDMFDHKYFGGRLEELCDMLKSEIEDYYAKEARGNYKEKNKEN